MTVASVGISASESAEAEEIGFDERMLNRLVVRMSEFFLFEDWRLVFGHDWREDGVMRAVSELAHMASLRFPHTSRGGEEAGARILNLVPTGGGPISEMAQEAVQASRGVLEAFPLGDRLRGDEFGSRFIEVSQRHRFAELWLLRRKLTEELSRGIRVCLGGRMDGYSGCYPGIAEEAWFAFRMRVPLYLIGGFGGATGVVAGILSGKHEWEDAFPPSRLDLPGGTADLAELLKIPMHDGHLLPLGSGLNVGMDYFCEANGLSEEENLSLFACTDVEAALELIEDGARRKGLIRQSDL